jgi:3-oxoacyl-[acyl-carrier-protein] synthase-3
MTRAAITGWGKCMPPAVLTNADLATFLDTDDAWITQRTGIQQRRISHVLGSELSYVAAKRALACAGLAAKDLDLVVYGSCSSEEVVPNTASAVQYRLGAWNAGAMDLNTACTSFLYGLSTASGLIRAGSVRNALVVGVENISPFMDWENRGVAVLFGDGCAAVVLQATDDGDDTGLVADKLGCYADSRQILRVRGHGTTYSNRDVTYGDTAWDFDGQEIFKRAVHGMGSAAAHVLARAGVTPDDVQLCVPHQANLRIIEFVAKRAGIPMERVFLTVRKYGNMSSATVPVALVEALEEGRIAPRSLLLMPAFGAGLTFCAHLVRFGERVTPIDTVDVELPPCDKTALQLVNELRTSKGNPSRSAKGLAGPIFPETQAMLAGSTAVA